MSDTPPEEPVRVQLTPEELEAVNARLDGHPFDPDALTRAIRQFEIAPQGREGK